MALKNFFQKQKSKAGERKAARYEKGYRKSHGLPAKKDTSLTKEIEDRGTVIDTINKAISAPVGEKEAETEDKKTGSDSSGNNNYILYIGIGVVVIILIIVIIKVTKK